jgi:RNA polymerase sigma-70 factor, ECF subfamily
MSLQEEPDEALYHRLRNQGDMAAFDALYQRYERRLFGFLRGYLPARADAEEIFHDAFIQVLRSREVRFERGSFAAWLYKIGRNLALNRLRSRRRGDEAVAAAAAEARPDPAQPAMVAPAADERVESRERDAALAKAVAALPPTLAEVYQLRVSGMSYEEIAFTLGVPLGTVKSRTHEMVSRLKTGVIRWTGP